MAMSDQTERQRLKRLVFHNRESRPLNVVVETTAESAPLIMAWYGAYFAGDTYDVTFDGRNVRMDHNGEPTEPIQ